MLVSTSQQKPFCGSNSITGMLNKSARQLHEKIDVVPADLRLSVVKPLGAQWMMKLYDYLKSKSEIIENGFRAVGIVDCLTS